MYATNFTNKQRRYLLKRCGPLKCVRHFIHVILRHPWHWKPFHFECTNYLLFVDIWSVWWLILSSPALIFRKSALVVTTLKGSHQKNVFLQLGMKLKGCILRPLTMTTFLHNAKIGHQLLQRQTSAPLSSPEHATADRTLLNLEENKWRNQL